MLLSGSQGTKVAERTTLDDQRTDRGYKTVCQTVTFTDASSDAAVSLHWIDIRFIFVYFLQYMLIQVLLIIFSINLFVVNVL